jgi:hypothetical protein
MSGEGTGHPNHVASDCGRYHDLRLYSRYVQRSEQFVTPFYARVEYFEAN